MEKTEEVGQGMRAWEGPQQDAICNIFFKDFISLFLDRGKRREKEKERNIDVREKHQLVASHMNPN